MAKATKIVETIVEEGCVEGQDAFNENDAVKLLDSLIDNLFVTLGALQKTDIELTEKLVLPSASKFGEIVSNLKVNRSSQTDFN